MSQRAFAALPALLTLLLVAGCASASPHGASPAMTTHQVMTTSTPTVAVARPAVYVAIGASDTFGYGVPDPATQGWVPRFASTLPAGTQVVNLGVVGITLQHALAVDLPIALDAHPTVVTVWLVVNDLLGGVPLPAYRADLHRLLTGLRQGTHARVLVGNVPDLTLLPTVAAHLGPDAAGTIASWNAAIATEVQQSGATLVDLHAGWQELATHPEYVGPDGLHPSASGYARIAAIFAAAL